jgi:hypothetical protein
MNTPSQDLTGTLELLPENWLNQQAEMRLAWERLIECEQPHQSAYFKQQFQNTISDQRAYLVNAYALSWQNFQVELIQAGLQEQAWSIIDGIQVSLQSLEKIQLELLSLRTRFDAMYSPLPVPESPETQQCLKKFWQNQARLSDSLKMNNETAFKMAQDVEEKWRLEWVQIPGLGISEKLSIRHLSLRSFETLGYYFSLRTLLTHRLRRMESGQIVQNTDLMNLRKLTRELSGSNEQKEPESLPHAWRLSLMPQAEGFEVVNELGLSLSQLNRSYLDYLKTGFYWLEQSVAQDFAEPTQLIKAAEAFFKALSVNSYSYESYWALACICFLTGQSEMALGFLEQAVKETRDPGLRGLQEVLELHAR